jgi:membrane-associated phospholipid phosphatase
VSEPPAPRELVPGDPANIGRLALWVRGSLYVSEFLSGLAWRTGKVDETHTASLVIDGKTWVTLHRPSAALLQSQCRYVAEYAALRDERQAEILSQLGFPTAYFAMILGLQAAEHKHTLELVTPRRSSLPMPRWSSSSLSPSAAPDQVDGRLQPMIPTPGHGSYPSAHATEAYAVLTVLEALTAAWGTLADRDARVRMLRGLAERIAVNRTVAGVHYPVDSWAGAVLGQAVGRAVLGRCGQLAKGGPVTLAAARSTSAITTYATLERYRRGPHQRAEALSASATPVFSWVWARAVAERQGE